MKLRASLCFHATVGIFKGPVSTPCPPGVKLCSGPARAVAVLCVFCPCLVCFSGSRVRVVWWWGSSGARSPPQNHPGCLQTSLLKTAVLSLCTSGSHMERHELDVESPLAEVGGILA